MLCGLGQGWNSLRDFCLGYRSLVEFAFICRYAVEQLILLALSYRANTAPQIAFIVSVFAVVILTTFAVHKLVMESRIRNLEEQLTHIQMKYRGIGESWQAVSSEHDELIDKITKEKKRKNI